MLSHNKIYKKVSWCSVACLSIGIQPALVSCSYEACYKKFEQLAPFLHYIEFDSFPFDYNFRTIHHYPVQSSGKCSAIVKGQYIGRNFDQNFTTMPEFIIKVNSGPNRHASIGLGLHQGLREPSCLSYKFRSELNLLPNNMMDGINDCGVFCECNTVHYEPNWSEWHGITVDDPEAPTVHMCFLVRYILDNATSAKNAIDLVKKINIVGSNSIWLSKDVELLHFLVSDAKDSFMIEFINNQMFVIDYSKYDIPPLSTNFYLWPILNGEEPYNLSSGIERFYIMLNNYQKIEESVDGLKNFLKSIAFSNFYNPHYDDPENFWLSEGAPYSRLKIWWKYLNQDPLTPDEQQILDKIMEGLEKFREENIPWFWHCIENNLRLELTQNHISYHTSVYDTNNKSLTVWSQENYNKLFYFEL